MKLDYSIGYSGAGFLNLKIRENASISGYLPNISGWLSSDVEGSGEDYLPQIKKVLEGEVEEEEFWGNAYKVVIHKDYTTISYDFEYCNPKMVPCTLPTEMLYEIIEIWIKACEEHRSKQN